MESFRQMLNAVYFAAATAGGKDILLNALCQLRVC